MSEITVTGTSYDTDPTGILLVKKDISSTDTIIRQKIMQDMMTKGEELVNQLLNHEAQLKNYGDIVSACSYAGAPNPFQAESAKFLTWRGAVWSSLYQYVGGVIAGVNPMPSTMDEVLVQLPKFSDF